jgi:hypothetical protein
MECIHGTELMWSLSFMVRSWCDLDCGWCDFAKSLYVVSVYTVHCTAPHVIATIYNTWPFKTDFLYDFHLYNIPVCTCTLNLIFLKKINKKTQALWWVQNWILSYIKKIYFPTFWAFLCSFGTSLQKVLKWPFKKIQILSKKIISKHIW